jgi:hypothetical protein
MKTEDEMVAAYLALANESTMAKWFRPHPQDGSAVARMLAKVGIGTLDASVPLAWQLSHLGGKERVVVGTVSSNAGLLAKLAGYPVVSSSGWYRAMNAQQAFGVAVDGQFNCAELERWGGAILGVLAGRDVSSCPCVG